MTLLPLHLVREAERQRGEEDPAGHGQAEGEPEGTGRRVDARSLADVNLLHRGQGVVVQLRHEQPQAGSGNHQQDDEVPPAVDPGYKGDDQGVRCN